MKRILAILLLLMPIVINAQDYDVALQAMNNGDFAAALKDLRPLSEQGDARAQLSLGMMYAAGKGVPQDYKEAVKLYRMAAAGRYADAQFNLGLMLLNGTGVTQDRKEAASRLRLAAYKGIAEAQMLLGQMYFEGTGVTQDYDVSAKWIRKAAEQDLAPAQSNLGAMYEAGQGVPQDYEQAFNWYRKAAEKGDARAQSGLERVSAQSRTPLQHLMAKFESPFSVDLAVAAAQHWLDNGGSGLCDQWDIDDGADLMWAPYSDTPAKANLDTQSVWSYMGCLIGVGAARSRLIFFVDADEVERQGRYPFHEGNGRWLERECDGPWGLSKYQKSQMTAGQGEALLARCVEATVKVARGIQSYVNAPIWSVESQARRN